MRDDDEEEAAVGVGRAGGVSEARRACLAPALWSRARGDAEAVEGTDLGGVGGGNLSPVRSPRSPVFPLPPSSSSAPCGSPQCA